MDTAGTTELVLTKEQFIEELVEFFVVNWHMKVTDMRFNSSSADFSNIIELRKKLIHGAACIDETRDILNKMLK